MDFKVFKLLIVILVLFNINSIDAQGNLQFNQIVMVTDIQQTVPSGKVWKIESYRQQQVGYSTTTPTTGCSDLSRARPYFIDNYQYHDIEGVGTGVASYPHTAKNSFPIWLKAGQVVKTSCPGDFLSIVEFNITP